MVSRRSGDEEEILSGWHRRRKGADRRRSDTEDVDDEDGEEGFRDVDEKVRTLPVVVSGNNRRDSRCWGPMAVLPCDARGCPKAQDAPVTVHVRAAADANSPLAATSPARRGL